MTTTINASTSSGLVQTADTSGVLQLQTANTAAVTIDGSQNVGIGTASPTTKTQISAATGGSTTGLSVVASGNMLNMFGSSSTNAGVILDATNGTVGSATAVPTIFRGGGTETMRIDSSGNVGIGTTSPSSYGKFVTYSSGGYASIDTNGQISSYQLLDVATAGGRLTGGSNQGELGQIAIEQATTGSKGGYIRFSTAPSGSNTSTERMRIDSSGNLLIGQTSGYGGGILDVKATANVNASSVYVANSSYTNNALILYCNSTTTNNSYKYYAAYTNSVGYKFYVIDSGAIYSTSTSITSISDQRFKENIKDIDVGLTQVMALKPRRFDWMEGKGENRKNAVGFIAQEVQEVLPDLVTHFEISEEDKTEYLGLRSQDLIPTLVKAIQEQQAIITDLKARIETLEKK